MNAPCPATVPSTAPERIAPDTFLIPNLAPAGPELHLHVDRHRLDTPKRHGRDPRDHPQLPKSRRQPYQDNC